MIDAAESEAAKPAEIPPPVAMLQMIQGFWISRALYAVAALGIPDLLKDGPRSIAELSASTGMHEPSLYRLMRALFSCGVFSEEADQRFSLTPLGSTLRTDVHGSLRYFAMEELGGNHYRAWERVLDSLETGGVAFELVYGSSKWKYHVGHPEEAKIFDAAMTSFSSVVNEEVVASYDFSASREVVDIGGGKGSLLATILKANGNLHGVLSDLPQVIDGAKAAFVESGLEDRCDLIAGDFFTSVPQADTYIIKWIIHDWDDDRAISILKNCREAMTSDGKIVLVESIVEPGRGSSFTKLMDLNMLVMTGGRERTQAEYVGLFEAAGLTLTRVIPTGTPMSLIEGVRKG